MAQLRRFYSEIKERQTQVVLISFGTTELGQKWITETRASYQFLLDPARKAYQAYGLEYSLLRSWSPKIWFEYARLMMNGRKWRGIQGDSGQLGGDFIVDREGTIRMIYCSHDPADRPSVRFILEKLAEINGDHSTQADNQDKRRL